VTTAGGTELSTRQLQVLGLLRRGATIEYTFGAYEGPRIVYQGKVILHGYGTRSTMVRRLLNLGLIQEVEPSKYTISEAGIELFDSGTWRVKVPYLQAVKGRDWGKHD